MPDLEGTPVSSPLEHEAVSVILTRVCTLLEEEGGLTVGHVLASFGVRGIAFLLFSLALFNVVIFMIPGLSILFGIPMILLAAQMVLGFKMPAVPAFLSRQPLEKEVFLRGLHAGISMTSRIEKYIRPRLLFLSGKHLDRTHGLLALVLAVMVAVPVPFLNLPPSFGVIFLGLGLLQRDGLLLIASYVMAFWSLWLFESIRQAANHLVG